MFSSGISPLTYKIGESLIRSLGLADHPIGHSFLRRDFRAVVEAEVNPSTSSRDVYLLSQLFSKFPFSIGIDRKAVALNKFIEVEDTVRSSDANLKLLLSRPYMDRDFHWIFHSMKVKLAKCLGSFSWSLCEPYLGFGPGASVDVRRGVSQVPNKFGKTKPTVTYGCLDLAIAAVCSHSVWRDFHTSVSGPDPELWFTIVPGNKVVTVPKNSKTERTIAIEPTMNMYIQKGIGGLIRKRLRYVGVNLNDQSVNQHLARVGSLTGSLSTVDLSSASDSVSWFLCQELLPPDWLSALEQSRSPRGVLPDGTIHWYRKVSSMGNGFTFELESLIFWALCSSVVDYLGLPNQTVSVYGDDLIVPVEAHDLVVRVLSLIGFTTNPRKTFSSGDFRESCGKHYSCGSDVSPFYIRENIESSWSKILLLNLIRHWSRSPTGWGCDERLKPCWDLILDEVPKAHRCFGPLYLGNQLSDSCIGVEFDSSLPSVRRAANCLEGYYFPRLSARIKTRRLDHLGSLICFLDDRTGTRTGGEWSKYSVLDHSKISRKRGLTPQWPGIGPWLPTTA